MSLEDGIVKCFDVRTAISDSQSEQSSTFTLHAHDKNVTSVSYNPSARNVCIFNTLVIIPTYYVLQFNPVVLTSCSFLLLDPWIKR